jgi:hypothetical protein
MIEAFVRSFLGEGGSLILDLYLQYSLVINGAILLYALLLFGSRTSYKRIEKNLVEELLKKDGTLVNKENQKQVLRALQKQEIPWNMALQATHFPLITHPGGWIVYPKTEKNLKRLFSTEAIANRVLSQKRV